MTEIETSQKVNRTARLIFGGVILLSVGLLFGWSIFRDPLTAIFPEWTPTRISITFTLSIVMNCIGGFTSGILSSRIPYRTIVRIAVALIIIGFVMITVLLDPSEEVRSLHILYIFYGVIVGFGAGLAFNSIMSSVMRWYPDLSGMAAGILMFGYGLGGMALGSVVNGLANNIGIINTFAVIGVIMAVIMLVLSIPTRIPSASELEKIAAAAPVTRKASSGPQGSGRESTLTETMKSPAFWLLFFWGVTAATCGMTVLNSAANIADHFGAPALLGLITTVFFSLGCLLLGYSFDRLGRRRAMLVNAAVLLIGGLSLTLGAIMYNVAFIFVGISCIGFGFGGNPPMMSAATMSFFGAKHFAINYATISFCLLVAAIIGPLLSSRLQEIAEGSYLPAFIMIIIVSLINLVIVLVLNRMSKKRGLEK